MCFAREARTSDGRQLLDSKFSLIRNSAERGKRDYAVEISLAECHQLRKCPDLLTRHTGTDSDTPYGFQEHSSRTDDVVPEETAEDDSRPFDPVLGVRNPA